MEVMPPDATSLELLENTAKALGAIFQSVDSWGDAGVMALLFAGFVTVLKIASSIPGVYGMGAKLLHAFFAPKVVKEAAQRVDVASQSLWTVVQALEHASAQGLTLSDVKREIKSTAPPSFLAMFEEWKRQQSTTTIDVEPVKVDKNVR